MTTRKTGTTKREYLGPQLVKLGRVDQLTLGPQCNSCAECGCGWRPSGSEREL